MKRKTKIICSVILGVALLCACDFHSHKAIGNINPDTEYNKDTIIVTGQYLYYACEKCARFKLDSGNSIEGEHVFLRFYYSSDSNSLHYVSNDTIEQYIYDHPNESITLYGHLSKSKYGNGWNPESCHKFLVLDRSKNE